MKRSIHGAKLRFRDTQWEFYLIRDHMGVTPGVLVRQGHATYGSSVQELKIYKDHLPAFIAFLRWALTEIQEEQRQKRAARKVSKSEPSIREA